MFGRKVEDMRMAWIAQECPALHTMAQGLGHKGHLAPLRHHTADVKAPVGVEIIHHPVVTVHVWQWLDDMGQMGSEIGTGAGLNEAIKARVPCRMYSCSHFSGLPGAIGCVGYVRSRICIPVFSSLQMTTRPCSKTRRALM